MVGQSGCVDVVKGLCESTAGHWSGDVDLNDGQLQLLFQKYKRQLQWINSIGLNERRDYKTIQDNLLSARN